jgi:signal transduction histidine kinase
MSNAQTVPAAAASPPARATYPPAMLIRAMTGVVTSWPPAMEQRYGFTSSQVSGQLAHRVLRTNFWKPLAEIEVVLLEQRSWFGGLLHHRADGHLIMTAHEWRIHHESYGSEPLVRELHTDIIVDDERSANIIADIVAVIGHELSQPMTAIGNYLAGARQARQSVRPDGSQSIQAVTAAGEQLARNKQGMALLRRLSETLRQSDAAAMPRAGQSAGAPMPQAREADDF